ncbi:MAG: hypothetical protein K9L30_11360 [Desulfobacterales bacterium]|nr:hypothetical protein [Desulfobacterales bacterium]
MTSKHEVAILFSGGTDSLALYALYMAGKHRDMVPAGKIHLLCMLNGMSRFDHFPVERFKTARKILAKQAPDSEPVPETEYTELDTGRLFQGLWLDHYETLMPKYNGKNMVCVACKLAMHVRAVIYCVKYLVCDLVAGYTVKQSYYPEQTDAFMSRIIEFSGNFGIATHFPVYEDFSDEMVTRHVLEDFGLPSSGGGERKCLFGQTYTTAAEEDVAQYLDDMLPVLNQYVESKLEGDIRGATACFPAGRVKGELAEK